MALHDHAPFGSTGAVVKTLETYRETGLGGAPISKELIGRLGYGEEVSRRVVSSLEMLELISDGGEPTETLRNFKQAPGSDYRQLLAEHLLDMYAPIFAITGTNIEAKSHGEIEDAFRPFKPESLRKRMVALFLGLCGYVGITSQEPRLSSPRPTRTAKARAKSEPRTETHEAAATAADTAPEMTLDSARARYIDLLISKAEAADADAGELFDRIERVLGVHSDHVSPEDL